MKKLHDAAEQTADFLDCVKILGKQLGPILFQLPPHWHCDVPRLRSFLEPLPSDFSYAFEFRDPTWFNREVYDTLSEHNAAFCIYSFHDRQSPKEVTAELIYVRFHGTTGTYQGGYDTQTLAGWAGAFSTWTRQGHLVYAYFNNDEQRHAPANALALQSMLDRRG